MELPNYCPICGDSTTPTCETLGETNTTLFVKDPEFRRVFQCFNKLFEISEPPWLEKAFVFCSECKRQLTVVSELGEVMKEVEKRLKESEKVVKDKLKSSERNFESSGIYRRDKKYWKVRGQFLNRERLSSSVPSEEQPSATGEPPSQTSNASNYLHSEGGILELVKVEVEAPPLENTEIQVENNANILLSIPSTSGLSSHNEETTILSNYSSSSNQNESQDEDQRAKRRRVPPKRFDPDEYELNTKSKRAKSDSESNQNDNPGTRNVITMFISSGPNGEQQVVKVEEVQVQEYFDEGEELEEASHFEAETNGENDQQQKEHEKDDDSDFKIEEQDEQGAKQMERGKVSNNKKAFECLLCVRRLPDKKQFEQHIIEFHQSNETYKALVDVKATEAATRWMTPGLPEVSYYGITLSKIGDGMEYQCSKCGKVLPNPFRTTKATGLRNHVTEEHTELYKCGHCGQCFCDNKTLKCHERSVHQPPFLYLKE